MDGFAQAWRDQVEAQTASIIRRHGWAIQYVGGEVCGHPGCTSPESAEPGFAYTIGLFGMGHPELLVFGIDPDRARTALNELGERVRDGEALLPGLLIQLESWPRRVIPEEVPNPGDIVFMANAFYQRPAEFSVPVLQLSYDDVNGLFPWDDGCAEPTMQPRPGTFHA